MIIIKTKEGNYGVTTNNGKMLVDIKIDSNSSSPLITPDEVKNAKKIQWNGWFGPNMNKDYEIVSSREHTKFKSVIKELRLLAEENFNELRGYIPLAETTPNPNLLSIEPTGFDS